MTVEKVMSEAMRRANRALGTLALAREKRRLTRRMLLEAAATLREAAGVLEKLADYGRTLSRDGQPTLF